MFIQSKRFVCIFEVGDGRSDPRSFIRWIIKCSIALFYPFSNRVLPFLNVWIIVKHKLGVSYCKLEMSISIEGLDKAPNLSEVQHYLQYLPAKINYEGSANVHNFFTKFTLNKEEQKTSSDLTNVFRGRPLDGNYNIPCSHMVRLGVRIRPNVLTRSKYEPCR